MADNVTADAGSGGAVFATDDIGSVHYPITKVTIGALESQTLLSGGNGTVDAGTVRVTVASDSTGVLSIDDNGGSLTVDNGGTFVVQEDGAALTALQLLDNAVSGAGFNITQLGGVNVTMGNGASGTGVQRVTIASDSTGVITVDNAGTFATQVDGAALTALQLIDDPIFADDAAFTLASSKVMMQGAIRDDTLGALTAVEGDAVPLRVGSTGALHVTGAGGGTQYTVDDAGPTVVTMAGAVRDDALTTLTEVDGDATLLRVSSTGALHVTGGGGGTEYTEDVATANPIVGTTTLMERDDSLTTVTPAEADWIGLRGTAEGALWVQDFNSDAILVDTTSIDGKITACNTGAVVISSGTITTVSTVTNLAQMGGVAITLNTGTVTTGTQRVTIATDDVVTVDLGANNDVTIDPGAVTSLALIDNPVVAHDAAVSGSTGVAILGLEARSTEPTAVADADATRGISTLLGKQVTIPYAIPASTWQYASVAGGVTDTSDDEAKAAAGASIRNYITSVQVINGHATVNTEVVIKDGSTIIWRGYAHNSGGGAAAKFDPPLRGTANTAVNVTNITGGSATYFNLQGFVALE